MLTVVLHTCKEHFHGWRRADELQSILSAENAIRKEWTYHTRCKYLSFL